MAASGDAIAANALASSGATIELLERQVREGSVEAFDLNPPMILRHRGEIRLHMWVRNGPKETMSHEPTRLMACERARGGQCIRVAVHRGSLARERRTEDEKKSLRLGF